MQLEEIGKKAKEAESVMRVLDTNTKNEVLQKAAENLKKDKEKILSANAVDMENGRKKGMSDGLLDRLLLTEARIAQMAEGLCQVAALEDPIGEVLSMKKRPNGLLIGQKRVPLGVVGIIYEARPNVTADAFALCFKTGNVVILKGGSDALHSNQAIVESIQHTLGELSLPETAIQLICDTSHETAEKFISLFRMKHIVPHRRVQPVEGLQLRDVIGVGQKAHVQHQVGLRRQAVLKAEGEDVHVQLSLFRRGEEGQQCAAELGGGKGGGVQHHIGGIADGAEQLPLAGDGGFYGAAIGTKGMAAAGLLVAADDGGGVGFQKQQAAADAPGTELGHGLGQVGGRLTGTDIVDEGQLVVAAAGGGTEVGKAEHHLRREVVHSIVAGVLQKCGGAALAAAGQAGDDEYFHGRSPFLFLSRLPLRGRWGCSAPAGAGTGDTDCHGRDAPSQ